MRPTVVALLLAAVASACAPQATAPPTTPLVPAPVGAAPASPPAPSSDPETSERAADGGRCRLDGLRAELAAPQGAPAGQGERTVRVVWTNTSSRACTMAGFGGVDFERASSDEAGSAERRLPNRFSVPRDETSGTTVRLEPGGKAHSTIGYLSDRYSVDDFRAERVLVTPPDETRSAVLEWNGDTVLRGRTILEHVEPGAR